MRPPGGLPGVAALIDGGAERPAGVQGVAVAAPETQVARLVALARPAGHRVALWPEDVEDHQATHHPAFHLACHLAWNSRM